MYKNVFQGLSKTKFINFKVGSPEKMFVDERLLAKPAADEVYMKVMATGINPAEVYQRQGKYPVNAKNEDEACLGLEAVGEIYSPEGEKLFDGMALVSGGAYGQYLKVKKNHVMKMPKRLKFTEAAVITEAWLTAYQILKIGKVRADANVAINAATGSVGSAAIQICSLFKANPFVIVTRAEQIEDCVKLGAKGGVHWKDNANWHEQLLKLIDNRGFDTLLDSVCANHFKQNLQIMGIDSTWVLYSFITGSKIEEANVADILRKRISLIGSALKTRSEEYKTELIKNFSEEVLPHFDTGRLQLKIDSVTTMDWSKNDATPFIEAHQRMEDKKHSGKIVIEYKHPE